MTSSEKRWKTTLCLEGGNQSHTLGHASQRSTHPLHQFPQKQRELWFDKGKIQTSPQSPQTWNKSQNLMLVRVDVYKELYNEICCCKPAQGRGDKGLSSLLTTSPELFPPDWAAWSCDLVLCDTFIQLGILSALMNLGWRAVLASYILTSEKCLNYANSKALPESKVSV